MALNNINRFAACVLLLGCCTTLVAEAQQSGGRFINTSAVAVAPVIDGRGDEDAWEKAEVVTMTMKPAEGDAPPIELYVSSVSTNENIYFRVSWPDETKDDSHKTWMWNEATKVYEEGKDREDVVALAFAHTGVFSGDMLDGQEAVWDVWHWKAARTDLSGYAMDKTHRYTKEKPEGSAKSFEAHDGSTIWIARPEDTGGSVEKKQPAPSKSAGERVSQYVEGTPTGSAADVRAKGSWTNGRWTVEFSRKLDTAEADDTSFTLGIPISMAISVFDHVEHIGHRASEVWELEVLR